MLNNASGIDHIYIACGYTDLRSGIDRLAALVQSSFKLDPYQNSLFPFCGRRTDPIKGLLWEGDGFLLLYKRLETGSFQWPRSESGCGPQTSVFLDGANHSPQCINMGCQYQRRAGTTQGNEYVPLIAALRGIPQRR